VTSGRVLFSNSRVNLMRRSLYPVLFAVLITVSSRPAQAGIQLSSFTGTGTAGGVRLDWTTLTETNNFGFNIQRSLNAETAYQTIPNAFVGGAGTTGVPQTYSFTDTSAGGGTWYYRLQQIDLSGPVHYTYGILAHRPFFGQYLPDTTTHLLLHADETTGTVAHDLSPFHTHGAITGTTSVTGRFGAARSFAGLTHAIQLPDTLSLRVNALTLEAWVTSSSFAGMGPGMIAVKRRTSGGASYALRMSGTTGRVCFFTGASPGDSVVSSTTLQNGRWYHVAGVYDQSTIALFVNGVLEATRPLSGTIPYDGSGLWLGQDSAGAARWQGTIDEVRISAGARSASTFNLQLPPTGLTASLSGSTVLLDWQNGGGGIGPLLYRIYRGTDTTSLAVRDSTVADSYQDQQAPPNSLLYYRITAVDSSGFEGRSGITASILTPPAIPVLVFPLNGASGVLPPVGLQWRRSPGTSTYRVQLGLDSLFFTTLVDDSTVVDTTLLVSSLPGPARYYWRVSAKGVGGVSSPSTVRRFDVAGVPGTVTLVSPDPGAVIPALQVTLRWRHAAPPVSSYWVEVAQNPLFAGSIIDSTLTDTLLVFQPLQYGTQYWWRVRARNSQGWGLFSVVRSFEAQFILQVPLSAGWNMVSLPVLTLHDSLVEVYPTSIAPYAFAYTAPQGYVQRYVLQVGTGYWAKFPAGMLQAVGGAPVSPDSIPVAAGWNMIGSITFSVDTATVTSIPAGIRNSNFFGYNGALSSVATLDPGKAYWVKVSAPGVLILRQPAPQVRTDSRRTR
jgi:hypothetical protein